MDDDSMMDDDFHHSIYLCFSLGLVGNHREGMGVAGMICFFFFFLEFSELDQEPIHSLRVGRQ